jgi:hypothetical protein
VVGLVSWLAGAYGIRGAALAWLLAETGVQIVAVATARRTLRRPLSTLGVPIVGITVISGIGALVAWAIDVAVGGRSGLLAAALAASAAMLVLLLLLDRHLRLGFGAAVMLVSRRLGAFPYGPSARATDA